MHDPTESIVCAAWRPASRQPAAVSLQDVEASNYRQATYARLVRINRGRTGDRLGTPDLHQEGWCLVTTEAHRHLLPALEPLWRLRVEAFGGPPRPLVLPDDPRGDRAEADWRALLEHEAAKQGVGTRWPRQVLLLGDPDRLPFELQRALSTDHAVGRLPGSASPDALAAYVARVLRPAARRSATLWTLGADRAMVRMHHHAVGLLGPHMTRHHGLRVDLDGLPPASGMLLTVAHGLEDPDDPAGTGTWCSVSAEGDVVDRISVDVLSRVRADVVLSLSCFGLGRTRERRFDALGEAWRIDAPATLSRTASSWLLAQDGPHAILGCVDHVTSRLLAHADRSPDGHVVPGWVEALRGHGATVGASLWHVHERGRRHLLRSLAGGPDAALDLLLADDMLGFMALGDPAVSLGPTA